MRNNEEKGMNEFEKHIDKLESTINKLNKKEEKRDKQMDKEIEEGKRELRGVLYKKLKDRKERKIKENEQKRKKPHVTDEMLIGKEPFRLGFIKLGKAENKETGKIIDGRGYKEPITFYIREGGEVEIIEDCHSGILTVKGSDGNEKFHLLDPNKMLEIPIVTGKAKGWVIDENSALPYPHDSVYDSGVFNNVLLRLVDDVKGLDDALRTGIKIKSIGTVLLLLVFGLICLAATWGMIEPMIKSLLGG